MDTHKIDITLPKALIKKIFAYVNKNNEFEYEETYNGVSTNYLTENDYIVNGFYNDGVIEINFECNEDYYLSQTYYFNKAGKVYQSEEDNNNGEGENIEHTLENFIYDLFDKIGYLTKQEALENTRAEIKQKEEKLAKWYDEGFEKNKIWIEDLEAKIIRLKDEREELIASSI